MNDALHRADLAPDFCKNLFNLRGVRDIAAEGDKGHALKRMYGIVIAQCCIQRLEQKYRRPFARANAFGPGVKGSCTARDRLDGKGRIGLYRQINNMRRTVCGLKSSVQYSTSTV